MNSLAADAILVLHFTFVLFVVGGLAVIWAGAALGWRWIRGFWFRVAHLAAIVFVASEALAGAVCPLTAWEDALRGRKSESGFLARWIHSVLFYDLPDWVFTAAYLVFALIVALTFRFVPPQSREPKQKKGR